MSAIRLVQSNTDNPAEAGFPRQNNETTEGEGLRRRNDKVYPPSRAPSAHLRSMDGPPISMFSMHVSNPLPFATVASKGYRFSTTRSIAWGHARQRTHHRVEQLHSQSHEHGATASSARTDLEGLRTSPVQRANQVAGATWPHVNKSAAVQGIMFPKVARSPVTRLHT